MKKPTAYLFALAVACLLVALGLLFLTLPLSFETSEGQATIALRADRRSVAFPGDCVTLSWSVDGIREVYINGEPTLGDDSRQRCITLEPDSQPLLRVVLQDGTIREYPLPISITIRNPLVWLLGLAAVLMAGSAALLQFAPVLRGGWLSLKRVLRIAEYSLLIAAGIMLVLEVVLRLYFGSFGSEREKIMYLYSTEQIRGLPSRILPMPYVNYVPSPNFEGHNQLGYRGPEIEVPKPVGVFRIVALGGSTTYSTSTSAEESYPAQLQQILQADPYGYRQVEVVNAGVPGYSSWDTLVNYALRVTELDPDLLIVYEGVNDVAPRSVDPDCYRGENILRGIDPTRGLWRPIEIPVQSALYRLVALRLGWIPDPSALNAYSSPSILCQGPSVVNDERMKANPPVYFERNLFNIITLAKARHLQVMLSTWTYGLNGDPAALPPQWIPVINEHNAILRRLAAEFDLPLYDLAATDFSQHPEYWALPDPIHMAAAGTHEQARQYAAFIDEQGLIPR